MNGRYLKPPPLAVGGVAFVDFEELCKGHTGASDYLALANTFHTIVLRGVPVLKSYQAEAARFVNLVDVLYERQCRLAVSAALPPSDLLQVVVPEDDKLGHELALTLTLTHQHVAHSFQRAASRLEEMRSQRYWRACKRCNE